MIHFPFKDCWIFSKQLGLNTEGMKSTILNHKREIEEIHVAPLLKGNLKESHFQFLRECPMPHLENAILTATEECVYELVGDQFETTNISISESWYHIASYGGYHGAHNHSGVPIAGIYYVSTNECNENSGLNVFLKPYMTGDPDMYGPLGTLNKEQHMVLPEDDRLILFPGFLFHSASPYYGKSKRICIAFNIVFH